MYLQTKVNEKIKPLIVSDKEKEIAFAKMFRIFHTEIFVIYPHKCTSFNLKEKYQEKWENSYLRAKNARASRALRQALEPGQYWVESLIQVHFAHATLLCYVSKISKKISGTPLDQILDPLTSGLELFSTDFSRIQVWSKFSVTRILIHHLPLNLNVHKMKYRSAAFEHQVLRQLIFFQHLPFLTTSHGHGQPGSQVNFSHMSLRKKCFMLHKT